MTEHIITWLDDHANDPFGYLLGIIGRHPDAEDGIRQFLDRRRREMADADQPPRPPKPPWCGECDEQTRLAELDDGRMARCIRCHPLSVSPPEGSGPSWRPPPPGPRRAPACPECGRPYSPEQLADDEFYRLAMAGDAGCTHKAEP